MLVREEEAGLETGGEGRPEVPEVRRGGPLNRIPEKRGNTSAVMVRAIGLDEKLAKEEANQLVLVGGEWSESLTNPR